MLFIFYFLELHTLLCYKIKAFFLNLTIIYYYDLFQNCMRDGYMAGKVFYYEFDMIMRNDKLD